MKKNVVKIVLFFVAVAGVVASLAKLVTNAGDYRNYQWIQGFHQERENSLDAVYVGGSNVYAFWMSPVAWENYGITVYPLASNAQPVVAAEYFIREARKTQPDALYIVSLINTSCGFSESVLHCMLDYFPYTRERLELTKMLLDNGDYEGAERMEFYFPLLRYHSRWSELCKDDFSYEVDGLKGGSQYPLYLENSQNISGAYRLSEKRLDLEDYSMQALMSLLEYGEKENVKLLFVRPPQAKTDETVIARCNTYLDIVQEHGYPVLDMLSRTDEIGLDLTRDWYNEPHVNCHGSVKMTDYLCRYLMENYGFEDKRGDPAFSDWDEAFEKYEQIISVNMLDFEYNGSARDYRLAAPGLDSLVVNGTTLTLNWKSVEGADGYAIYRKTMQADQTEAASWEPIATVDADTLTYEDTEKTVTDKYTYTVASFREEDGERYWGTFDFNGLSAVAAMDAPQELTTASENGALTLTWDPVPGADGYQVARRVLAKSWFNIENECQDATYTDSAMLDGVPYQYHVRAYWYDEENLVDGEPTPVYGSWSADTLYLPEVPAPAVTAELVDGVPTLTWDTVEGITNYTVTRRTGDGDWERVAEPLGAGAVRFRDITAEAGTSYAYQVTANVLYGEDTYTYPSEPVRITAEAGPVQLAAPELLYHEQMNGTVQLLWEPAANATAYRIYRMAEGEDDWTMINGSVGGNAYQDKPPAAGEYTYVLQSLRAENGCTYYGQFDEDAGQAVKYSPD